MNIKKLIKHPKFILIYLDRMKIITLKDEKYLKLFYEFMLNKKLDLCNPQTFNEKLQWLKLNDRKDIYTKMVDKYEAKKIVANMIGGEYIIPTIGIYDRFEDIEFDKLPNQFVMKCTHDSGSIFICKNKEDFDYKNVKKYINKSLKKNFYRLGREWPYRNVKPRIIIEKYMQDNNGNELNDYKFMVFNGKVRCSFVCTERFSENELKVTFFDENWEKMPFERHYKSSSKYIKKPLNYEKMKELSEILGQKIPFVRVDFYEINDKIYFGELTFYPGCGTEEFNPEEWDLKLGKMIKLPKKIEKS